MGAIQAVDNKAVAGSPSPTTLSCDQAIFTSIRTPMGEGYRIIAASRGLRTDDKQAITRCSPSHDGLCHEPPQPSRALKPARRGGTDKLVCRCGSSAEHSRTKQVCTCHPAVKEGRAPFGLRAGPEAAAFYGLPSGRLCVALSCFAGAEHTGRGGKRVYTHCAIFDEKDFERCAYNAFNVIRAMVAAGLTSPTLDPVNPLPELQLCLNTSPDELAGLTLHPSLDSACRCGLLQGLFDERSMIIDIEDGWVESMEVLLLGVPGPMRSTVSFSAGARFSLGRGHRLCLMHDARGQTMRRVAGQPIDFINPRTRRPQHTRECSATSCGWGPSPWLTFVERHWSTGDAVTLAKRTSHPFADVSSSGRERIGRMYNHIDDIPDTETASLLAQAVEVGWCDPGAPGFSNPHDHTQTQEHGSSTLAGEKHGLKTGATHEREIADEFFELAEQELTRRFTAISWSEVKRHWSALVDVHGRSGGTGGAGAIPARRDSRTHVRANPFAHSLIQQALRCAMRDDPLDAASVALDIASHRQPTADTPDFAPLLDDVLKHLASWAQTVPDADRDELNSLCDRWEALRPSCPIIAQIRRNCATTAASG